MSCALPQGCQRGEAAQPGPASVYHTKSHRDLSRCSRFSATLAHLGAVPSLVLGHQGSLKQPRWCLERCSPSSSCAHMVQVILGVLGAGLGQHPPPSHQGPWSFSIRLFQSEGSSEMGIWSTLFIPAWKARPREEREKGHHATPSSSWSGEWPRGRGASSVLPAHLGPHNLPSPAQALPSLCTAPCGALVHRRPHSCPTDGQSRRDFGVSGRPETPHQPWSGDGRVLRLTVLCSLRLPQTSAVHPAQPRMGRGDTVEQDVGLTLEGLSSRRRDIHTLTQLCPNVSGDPFLR